MSDTPRTDAVKTTNPGRSEHWEWVEAQFCRQIELELRVAEQDYKEEVAFLANKIKECDGLKAQLAAVEARAEHLKEALAKPNTECQKWRECAEALEGLLNSDILWLHNTAASAKILAAVNRFNELKGQTK